jgi:hypothetical protein
MQRGQKLYEIFHQEFSFTGGENLPWVEVPTQNKRAWARLETQFPYAYKTHSKENADGRI